MAKATVQYKEVVQPIEKVTLEINQSEAITLLAILVRVGGSPILSPRKHSDAIYEALKGTTNIDYHSIKKTKEYKALLAGETECVPNRILFAEYNEV